MREDQQSGLFDRVYDVGETELAQLEANIRTDESTKKAAKENRKARAAIKTFCKGLDLKDGERVRIGRFVVTGRARNGGGFEIPAWESVTVKSIQALD